MTQKTFSTRLAACLLASSITSAAAQTTNVPFNAVVTSVCAVTVVTPGVMATSTDFKKLDSREAAGVAGVVEIINTGPFSVSAEAPSVFTAAPAGGGDNVNFQAFYTASGATTSGETPGTTQTPLATGVTNLDIDLVASKSTGVFPQGAYATEVVVRCE